MIPSGGGYTAEPLGKISFVFVVAPGHPLAGVGHLLGKAELSQYRAVSVSDSARVLQARTVGLLFGQDTLAVERPAARVAADRTDAAEKLR
jgi:DNA-binding transcriptional LysR family regulator